MPKPERNAYYVSAATAITSETLAHSILSQFPGVRFIEHRMPFVSTPEKALAAANTINALYEKTGVRPLVFTTFVNKELRETFLSHCCGFCLDFFEAFITQMEEELNMPSVHTSGASHDVRDENAYDMRMDAINYTLMHDDGQTNEGLDEADVILVGVSRCGKTPTSLFLAMQYGIKAANYPIIPEDFERGELPEALHTVKNKLFGLSISPERLSQIRNERRPGSRYASLENCRYEVTECERLMQDAGIKWLNSTTRSIEEISATILTRFNLKNASPL